MLQELLASRLPAETTSESRMPAPAAQAGFQSFFAARSPELSAGRCSADPDLELGHREAPQIEVVREEGQVKRIVVTCSCCEQITIDCEY